MSGAFQYKPKFVDIRVRPPRKGEEDVHALKPGERRTIELPLGLESFAFYDPPKKKWVAEAGDFEVRVGASSRDIRLTATFRLPETLALKR